MRPSTIDRTLRLAGLLLFAASFALPAVRMHTGPGGTESQPGWICAWVTGAMTGGLLHAGGLRSFFLDPGQMAMTVSGWANPLFLLAQALSFWPRTIRVRRVLAAMTVGCFAVCWVVFFTMQLTPVAGYFVWVGGALVAMGPDFADGARRVLGRG